MALGDLFGNIIGGKEGCRDNERKYRDRDDEDDDDEDRDKFSGGERPQEIASKWATILARRLMGESLLFVAQHLEMPYLRSCT
ncbi:hypothetical protein CEN50_18295 [Fischerella thermalis CCMEE 5268]|uniref:Uncharacterized protein n=1 Tax=Fischerella thermalis CCMEE 5268 TaxID=2019662 RepID=A0A2N6KCT9_9CYAN|nr:hypothetical protein CEN50_18295 [Fischerella thermalis CCMEE 5268]